MSASVKTAFARSRSAAPGVKRSVASTAPLKASSGTAPIARPLPHRDGARPPFFGIAATALKAVASLATADVAKKIEHQKELARRYGLPGERLVDFYDDRGNRNAETPEKLTSVDLAVLPHYQGKANACGTTSLAAMFDYWNPGKKGNDHFTIDQAIRTVDSFTAPDDLVRYAREHGYRAGMKTGAGLDDIQRMIDQGVPVQVIMEPLNPSDRNGKPDRSDFGVHYVTVTGYEKGPDGKISKLTISDPWGLRYTMGAENFMDRWSNLKVGNVPTGLDRVMIAYVPDDGRSITGPDGKTRKASAIHLPDNGLLGTIFNDGNSARGIGQGVMTAINGFKQGNLLKSLVGVGQAVLNAGPMVGTILGSWAREGGQKAIDWGKEKWNQGGVGNKILGGAAVVGGSIAYGAGWLATKISAGTSFVVNQVGQVATRIAEGVGSAVTSVARGVASAVSSVGSAVGSAAKAVGNGVKKLFSGW